MQRPSGNNHNVRANGEWIIDIEICHVNGQYFTHEEVRLIDQDDGETYNIESNRDGIATFTLPNGEYELELESNGHEIGTSFETTIVVDDGHVRHFVAIYTPPEEVDADIAVEDAETGDPIESATIEATTTDDDNPYEPGFEVETDENGEYDGTIPEVDEYEYTVSADDYEGESGTASTDEIRDMTVELKPENDDGDADSNDEPDESGENGDSESNGDDENGENDESDGNGDDGDGD